MRGIQQSLFAPTPSTQAALAEPKGVVYTRRWVVDLLLDIAGYTSERDLAGALAVEPAAGDGAFLGPMIERLVESCALHGKRISDCAGSLVAYELDEESAARARTLAVNILRRCGVEAIVADKLTRGWIRTGDYLLEATSFEADFVIGNPPYVRLEDIPEGTASVYRQAYPTMRGRADLYVAFFEAALHQLREAGTCAFICADRWMRNQYGGELRELVTGAFAVDVVIEMHDADAFHEEVDAYPAITVIRRQRQGSTVVASARRGVDGTPPRALAGMLLATAGGDTPALPTGFTAALVQTWFTGTDPWPCHSPGQLALLRKLEDRFPRLETSARVGIGVATGNDSVFITKDPDLVEPSRLLKLGLAADILEGAMRWSGHYLVDPWNGDGLVKLEQFPKLRAYFERHQAALKKRHTATNNVRGWYRTIDRVAHDLTDTPKLYIADIKSVLDPVLDTGTTYPHHNLYFVQSDEWDLEVLGGLLMSAIGQFFIESYGLRMRGGYLRFQAQYLRRIRVPDQKAVSKHLANDLVRAFRARDRQLANAAALAAYGIDKSEMEAALGH
jgi:hypothetical protein